MENGSTWDLYIDESGNFDGDGPVVVAGLLARRGVADVDLERLKQALLRASGGLPWPLHACVARKPAARVLAHMAFPACAPSSGIDCSGLDKAGQVLRSERQSLVEAALAQLQSGHTLHHDVIVELDRALAGASPSGLFASVRDICRGLDVAYRRSIETLRREFGEGQLNLLVAGESATGDFRPPQLLDRYLALLETLLHRAVDVVRLQGDESAVVVHPLNREICWPRSVNRHHMSPGFLGRFLDATGLNACGGRVQAGEVASFTSHVGVLHVLADFLSNQSWAAMTRDRALVSIEKEIELRCSISPATAAGHRHSHICAAGRAHKWLESGCPVPWDWASTFRWAREQAEEWK